MHARRVTWQNSSQGVCLCLVTDDDPAILQAIPLTQNVQVKAAGQGVKNLLDVLQDECVLRDVRATENFGKPSRRRLLPDEIVDRLCTISQWKFSRLEESSGLFHHGNQIFDGDVPKDVPSFGRMSHVAANHASVDLTYLGDRLARIEVRNLLKFKRLIWFSPA